MSRYRILICLVFIFVLSAPVMVLGQELEHNDPLWQVAFWNNKRLAGEPAVQTTHTKIDWNWGSRSPHPNVQADSFSARWTRYVDMVPGVYRFTATSDDGIRIYVDNRLLLDRWYDHPPQTFTAEIRLTAGSHLVVVEYFENTGVAVVQVTWEAVSPDRWYAEYFDNRWLAGRPVLVRDDSQIDFDWGYGSPARGIPRDGFSARWMGTLNLRAGEYRFTTSTDDGVRLWVNGQLLIDEWYDQPLTGHSGTLYVAGGVPIKMEYYENGEIAAAHLTWELVGDDDPPGVVIVDDSGPGFVKGGLASTWHSVADGHGGHLLWTLNNDRIRASYNWGRWYPELAAGRYEVFAYIPEHYTTTAQARYWVSHRHGLTLRVVDQAANGSRWVSLGTYWFRGTRKDYVSLADVTFEPYLSRLVAWDAIKWVPR